MTKKGLREVAEDAIAYGMLPILATQLRAAVARLDPEPTDEELGWWDDDSVPINIYGETEEEPE